jgi:UDP-glucose 4-epimerase
MLRLPVCRNENTVKNSLILGGNGFIGSHLVDRLLAEGINVRVFDKYKEYYREPLAGVEYCYADFGNRGLLAEALQDIDTVFHLISTTLPKTSNDDPVFDITSNVVETLFLLEQCVHRKIKKIVFISSGGTVYGIPKILPVPEDASTDPLCSYGICKLTIEKYLELYRHLYGLNYVIVRPSNAYGDRQKMSSIQGAIPVFLGKIAKGQLIEIWGDGEVVRDHIFVDDLVDAIYKAAILDTRSRIFNIGIGIGYSLNRIIAIIREITGIDPHVVYKEKRSFDVREIYLDITRSKNELLWQPATQLEAGIQRTWEFVRRIMRP